MKRILLKLIRKFQYINNTRAAYDYEPQRGGWEKYENSVFGNDETDSVFDPYVIMFESNFRMFVSERKNNGIIVTESDGGLSWNTFQISLPRGLRGSWEEKVNRAAVCCKGGKWMMWYTGQNETSSAIGIAASDDGIHFTRIQKRPVLTPEHTYEKCSVMNPCVLWDETENIFKMWYAAGEQYEPDVICYATSQDGLVWIKNPNNPILQFSEHQYDKCKVGGCDVIKTSDNKYLMFYIGYQNIDTARICVAESANGINRWKRLDANPIISPSKGRWDSDAVYKPTVVYNLKEKKFMLWYNGRRKSCERIGYAEFNLDR